MVIIKDKTLTKKQSPSFLRLQPSYQMENDQPQHQDPGLALEKGFEKAISPFQAFIKQQTTSSMILLACTLLALIISNSDLSSLYEAFLKYPFGIVLGEQYWTMSVHHWVNDGLMALFFFLLGMEMKREVLVGEIKEMERLLPVATAAIGGMLVPALIYFGLNAGTPLAQGWGIPMATDTAFAVGILALLRKRIPKSAFAFLTALAIIDDMGAIMVIALFYSADIHLGYLGCSFAFLLVLVLFNALGIRQHWVYFLMGFFVWITMLGSGVHATVAGILVAMTVPARPKRHTSWFIEKTSEFTKKFNQLEQKKDNDAPILGEEEQHKVIENLQHAAEQTTTPLRRWERSLEYPIALFVLPIFALSNAGVHLNPDSISQLWTNPMSLGIILGLIIGKGLGIPLFTWLALRSGLGRLPEGLNLRHILGIGMLGGMGFTMSIFISNLGFGENPETLAIAKTGILVASFIAGAAGYICLRFFVKPYKDTDSA